MAIRNLLVPAAVMSFGWCVTTHAQFRCDCTSVVDSCSADVAIRGSFVEITTDRQQCARVDYFIDGQPFVSVAVDGSDRQDWIARTGNPRIMVQSCQVCRENSASTPPGPEEPDHGAAAQGQSTDSPLQPLIKVAPIYPSAAQAGGQPGYVEVEFTVTPAGDVAESARRSGAAHQRVRSGRACGGQPLALSGRSGAVSANRHRASRVQSLRMRAPRLLQAPRGGGTGLGTAQSVRPRRVRVQLRRKRRHRAHECLPGAADGIRLRARHRQVSWDAGFASTQRRRRTSWCLQPINASAAVLSVNTPDGTRTYTYADSLVVTRAPNSQYWWIACGARRTRLAATRRVNGLARWIDSSPPSIRRIAAVSPSPGRIDRVA